MRTPQILDHRGIPIRKAELKQEHAAASTTSVRQPWGQHQAARLTPPKLARILRSSIEGDEMAYLELAEDMEERDPHYAGVLSTRKRQVSNLPIDIKAATDDPKDEEIAAFVREAVERDEFQDELFDILDAVGKGFSVIEIMWETSSSQWMPRGLEWRDPRFFTFDPADGKTILLRDREGNQPLAAYKYITHCAKAKSGLPIRGGLARPVAWQFLFKAFTVKDWAVFCEAYGQPVRIGKYGNGASEEDKQNLMRALSMIGTDFAAMIPDTALIELIEAKVSGNHTLYKDRADWLDQQVSKVVLGQTGTTDTMAGSGHAQSKIHNEVRGDIEDADARQLSATLNRDFARPIVDLNFGPQVRYPKIHVGRPDEEDISALVDQVVKLLPHGLKVSQNTMLGKIGLPEPEPSEELLGSGRAEPVKADDPAEADRQDETREAAKHRKAANTHAFRSASKPDAIEKSVDDMIAGEWEALTEPALQGLREELLAAENDAEALAIFERRTEGLNLRQLAERLSAASFSAYLAGLGDEDISG